MVEGAGRTEQGAACRAEAVEVVEGLSKNFTCMVFSDPPQV